MFPPVLIILLVLIFIHRLHPHENHYFCFGIMGHLIVRERRGEKCLFSQVKDDNQEIASMERQYVCF